MAFPNLYYKRTAATAKACYICNKPTPTVLATIDTSDFFYTCPVHLTDRGFATRAPEAEPESKKPAVSSEEIARVKREWEEKQRLKKDKEQGQTDGDEKKGTDGRKEGEGKDPEGGTKPDSGREESAATPSASPSDVPSKPTHERYVLHRNVFALRTADHRRRRQAAQTRDLAPRLPRLPGAPRSIP